MKHSRENGRCRIERKRFCKGKEIERGVCRKHEAKGGSFLMIGDITAHVSCHGNGPVEGRIILLM